MNSPHWAPVNQWWSIAGPVTIYNHIVMMIPIVSHLAVITLITLYITQDPHYLVLSCHYLTPCFIPISSISPTYIWLSSATSPPGCHTSTNVLALPNTSCALPPNRVGRSGTLGWGWVSLENGGGPPMMTNKPNSRKQMMGKLRIVPTKNSILVWWQP